MATTKEIGWPIKLLIGLATGLWAALLTFLLTVAGAQTKLLEEQAKIRGSITNIERDIKVITAARSAEAVEAQRTSAQRILTLEGQVGRVLNEGE